MQTSKKWVKVNRSVFTFWHNNQQIGTMERISEGLKTKTIGQLGDQKIEIKKTGFWKNHLEILDSNGQLVAKMYPEKWYAHTFILETNIKKYKLLIRNNPLAECVLQENEKDILAYGLSTKDGKACVKITTSTDQPNYLFDFILWYLFAPIATEQSADDLTFLMLIA